MNDYPLYTKNVFAVSPVAKRVYLEAGKSYPAYVDVTNPADAEGTLHYQVSVVPYSVVGEDYDADFTSTNEYSLVKDWITIDEPTGYVEPNDTARVNYTINVPADAPGGGQYCAIAVQSLPDEGVSDGQVAVQDVLEITSILYATVNGEIRREGEILENYVPFWSFENPVTTRLSLNNTGTVHMDAEVTLRVYSVLTGELMRMGESEEEEGVGEQIYSDLVMPGITKYSEHRVEGLPSLGVFRVSQEINYNGVINTNEQITILCPWWFLILVVATLAAVMAWIVSGVRKRKKKGGAKNLGALDAREDD